MSDFGLERQSLVNAIMSLPLHQGPNGLDVGAADDDYVGRATAVLAIAMGELDIPVGLMLCAADYLPHAACMQQPDNTRVGAARRRGLSVISGRAAPSEGRKVRWATPSEAERHLGQSGSPQSRYSHVVMVLDAKFIVDLGAPAGWNLHRMKGAGDGPAVVLAPPALSGELQNPGRIGLNVMSTQQDETLIGFLSLYGYEVPSWLRANEASITARLLDDAREARPAINRIRVWLKEEARQYHQSLFSPVMAGTTLQQARNRQAH